MTDLLFRRTLDHHTDLVLGEDGPPEGFVGHVSIGASFPAIRAQAQSAVAYGAQIATVLPMLTVSIAVQYRSETSRPVVGTAADAIQVAERAQGVAIERVQLGATLSVPADVSWQEAEQIGHGVAAVWSESMRARSTCAVRFQRAVQTEHAVGGAFQDAVNRRVSVSSKFEEARHAAGSVRASFQDALRDRRLTLSGQFEEGRLVLASISRRTRPAVSCRSGADSRFQNAQKPLAGMWIEPTVPIPGRYVPPAGDAVHLLFREPLRHHVNLVFGRLGEPAAGQIIIPTLRTYIVINSASLTRVSNNLALPVSSISMSIDVDNAHWQWSASLPLAALPNLERDSPDQPVELEAVCNGFTARLLVTKLTERERFDGNSLQIGGNGIAAEISAPMYASVPHTNASALNAQQLAEQALMYNGVPLGWSLDWQAPDWLVPAGTWVHMGTPLDAVATIAAAAGAYVQADPAIRTLHILPRYPAAPWEWSGLPPAFVLPSSAVIERGTEHVDRASYNAVEVRGMAGGGVRARVVRAGTAGDLEAQQVVDRLITHQDAARGRGLEILGNTGQQRIVKLETGILPVSGVIPVGSILDWTRGEQAVRGIVRNLSISASVSSGRAPIVVRQTIGVETHA